MDNGRRLGTANLLDRSSQGNGHAGPPHGNRLRIPFSFGCLRNRTRDFRPSVTDLVGREGGDRSRVAFFLQDELRRWSLDVGSVGGWHVRWNLLDRAQEEGKFQADDFFFKWENVFFKEGGEFFSWRNVGCHEDSNGVHSFWADVWNSRLFQMLWTNATFSGTKSFCL